MTGRFQSNHSDISRLLRKTNVHVGKDAEHLFGVLKCVWERGRFVYQSSYFLIACRVPATLDCLETTLRENVRELERVRDKEKERERRSIRAIEKEH